MLFWVFYTEISLGYRNIPERLFPPEIILSSFSGWQT